jgi:hypothetical protein
LEIIDKYFADKRKKQLRALAKIAEQDDEILEYLKKLYFFEISFNDKETQNYYSKRAGWTLDFIAQKDSKILFELSPRLIKKAISEDSGNDYGTVQLLSNIDFFAYDYGKLIDVCLNICAGSNFSHVHKIYSLRILKKIILKNPELSREISDSIAQPFKHFTAPSLRVTKREFLKFLDKLS